MNMFIRDTKIKIPYTLQDSTEQKSMSVLCKYCDKPGDVFMDDVDVYSIDLSSNTFFNEDISYIGYSNQFIIKSDPLRYNIIGIDDDYKLELKETPDKFIRLYFPIETISTYYRGRTKYLISIYIYVNNIRTYLYNDIIDTFNDCKACAPFVNNQIHYQEYCDIFIPNPNTLVSSDTGESTLNMCENDEYLLNICIHPVYFENDAYYVPENCQGGSSFISFTQTAGMDIDTVFNIENKSITTNFKFSRRYVDSSNIKEYIENVYFTNIVSPEYTLTLHYYLINKYDEVVYMDNPIIISGEESTYSFGRDDMFEDIITSWSNWTEGLLLKTQFEVYNKTMSKEDILDDEWEEYKILTLNGNTISINSNIFKYIIPIEDDNIISFDNIDMNAVDITVYNKVINNNIKVNQNSVGSGVVKPLFYRAYEVQNITLHRDMKENICVNLDEYKSKCDKFYIKICGNYFPEYARNYDGVIFNVNGSCITSATGSYYVCDSDKNFITSGKYKCE